MAEQLQREAVTSRPEHNHDRLQTDVVAQDLHVGDREGVVFRHDGSRLLRAALSMWPLTGLFILGPFLAFGNTLFDRLGTTAPDVEAADAAWWWIPAGLVGFIVVSVTLNVVRVMLQDWELTLRSTASTVRRTSGLFSRTSKASAIARVQVVSSNQNPIQRLAGVRDVGLSTIGDGDISLIGCDDDQFDAVRRAVGLATDGPPPQRRVHPAEIWLAVRNTTVLATAIVLAGHFVIGWWSLATLLVLPPVWIGRLVRVRNHRWSLGEELITLDKVVDLSTAQAQLHKANAVTVSQSLFERRRNLGRVKVATAAGAITIGMIGIDEAKAVRDVVLAVAETDTRSWM